MQGMRGKRCQLIVPKKNIPIEKVKNKGDDKRHKTAEELASSVELNAPLTWAQRLKRVFNMMGPPSDFPMPYVWRNYVCHRTGPPSDY